MQKFTRFHSVSKIISMQIKGQLVKLMNANRKNIYSGYTFPLFGLSLLMCNTTHKAVLK